MEPFQRFVAPAAMLPYFRAHFGEEPRTVYENARDARVRRNGIAAWIASGLWCFGKS
jgi:hypothetical protein